MLYKRTFLFRPEARKEASSGTRLLSQKARGRTARAPNKASRTGQRTLLRRTEEL